MLVAREWTKSITKRWLVIPALLGVIAIVAFYATTKVDVAVAPSPPVSLPPPTVVGEPTMPRGGPAAPLRNPFGLPWQETARVKSTGLGEAAQPNLSRGKPAALKLTGIVVSGNRRAAIIEVGGLSRSYLIGESVGPYRLEKLTDRSATLTGPDGHLVLVLGG